MRIVRLSRRRLRRRRSNWMDEFKVSRVQGVRFGDCDNEILYNQMFYSAALTLAVYTLANKKSN